MLRQLTVRNFAIISEVSFEPKAGLNVFTGETGAGKSVAISALAFVLGARGSVSLIKDGASFLEVRAVFDNTLPEMYQKKYDLSAPTFTLRRNLDKNGKGKSFLNDKPVSAAVLAQIGRELVDFHGQHEHQSLLLPEVQLNLLDQYGDLTALRRQVADAFDAWQEALARLQAASLSEQEKQRQLDLIAFQLQEIEKIAPKEGEDVELEQKLPQLKHAGRLSELAARAYADLYEAENAAVTLLGRAARQVSEMASLDEQTAAWADTLQQAENTVSEVADEISRYQSHLQVDPQSLDELLSRHEKLRRLKLKYGPELSDVLHTVAEMKAQQERLQNAELLQEELAREVQKTRQQVDQLCEQLHTQRLTAARRLARALQTEIQPLGFAALSVDIAVEMDAENPTASGADRVEFLFSANAGQAPRPLRAIASGGELSRVMLGLKTVLAGNISLMIFDEVDSGIGGRTAALVGQKLRAVAQGRQVFCVTHLATVAAGAQAHFYIEKKSDKKQTAVSLCELTGEQIIAELARMLGGAADETALAHARQLYTQAQQ